MQVITVDEIVDKKILPFNLYNENGEKIFSVGEVLTPGKLLQLRHISVLYKDEDNDETYESLQSSEDIPTIKTNNREKKAEDKKSEEYYLNKQHELITADINSLSPQSNTALSRVTQNKLANIYETTLSAINSKTKTPSIFTEARDQLVENILPIVETITHKSKLKLEGKYEKTHGINVAILSIVLASKLKVKESMIGDIALAAMLHDIGKTRIPEEILNKVAPSNKELKIIQLHPQMGYKILKHDLEMPEHICKVALEHHEHSDGTGYPYGISGELISFPSQVVAICNLYDNLVSNKGPVRVANPKEATKHLLTKTRLFHPEIVYTFIHMTCYNDMKHLSAPDTY